MFQKAMFSWCWPFIKKDLLVFKLGELLPKTDNRKFETEMKAKNFSSAYLHRIFWLEIFQMGLIFTVVAVLYWGPSFLLDADVAACLFSSSAPLGLGFYGNNKTMDGVGSFSKSATAIYNQWDLYKFKVITLLPFLFRMLMSILKFHFVFLCTAMSWANLIHFIKATLL